MSMALSAVTPALYAQTTGETDVEETDGVTIYKGAYISDISSNGKWLAGAILESASVVDVEKKIIYVEEGQFELGTGSRVADNGVIAGDISTMAEIPGYFKDGNWYYLPTNGRIGLSRAITPDGQTLIGILGTEMQQGYDGVTHVPAIWHATGSDDPEKYFGDPEILPYPEKDFTGRAPQIVSTMAISDDGNVIMGQMWDNYGYVTQPVVWTKGDDGKWTYRLYCSEMLNPDNVQFPEWVGDGPESPNPVDFMPDEEREQYNEDLNEWMAGGSDPDEYPEPEEYMTSEEIDAYNEAMEKFLAEYDEWNEKWIAFMTVYQEVRNNPNFKCIMINSGKMNPQGTYFIADWSHTGSSPDGTMKIDIASGNTEDIKVNFRIGQILRDGSMTGRIDGNTIVKIPDVAYVWPAGKEPMTLFDYFEQTKPEFAEFMDDYMTHMVTSEYDGEQSVQFSGFPCATNGLEVIATGVYNIWADADEPDADKYPAFSYLFDTNKGSGINAVLSGYTDMKVNGSVITLGSKVSTLEIYDLSGALVLSMNKPGMRVEPALEGGVYVIRATSETGVTTVLKARL